MAEEEGGLVDPLVAEDEEEGVATHLIHLMGKRELLMSAVLCVHVYCVLGVLVQ